MGSSNTENDESAHSPRHKAVSTPDQPERLGIHMEIDKDMEAPTSSSTTASSSQTPSTTRPSPDRFTSSNLPPIRDLIGSLSPQAQNEPSQVRSLIVANKTTTSPASTYSSVTAALSDISSTYSSFHCLRLCRPHICVEIERQESPSPNRDSRSPVSGSREVNSRGTPRCSQPEREEWKFENALKEIARVSLAIIQFVDKYRDKLKDGDEIPSEKELSTLLNASARVVRHLKAIRCVARDAEGKCCIESARRRGSPSPPLEAWTLGESGSYSDEEELGTHHRHTTHDHKGSDTSNDNHIAVGWARLSHQEDNMKILNRPASPGLSPVAISPTAPHLGIYHFGKGKHPAGDQFAPHQHHHGYEQHQAHHQYQHPRLAPNTNPNQHPSMDFAPGTAAQLPTEEAMEPRIELAAITIARASSTAAKPKAPDPTPTSPTFTSLFSPTAETYPRKRGVRGERGARELRPPPEREGGPLRSRPYPSPRIAPGPRRRRRSYPYEAARSGSQTIGSPGQHLVSAMGTGVYFFRGRQLLPQPQPEPEHPEERQQNQQQQQQGQQNLPSGNSRSG